MAALTLLAAWSSSTLPPLDCASSVPAVIGAAAVCVMLPADTRPSVGAVIGAFSAMLPPPPFCSVSAEAVLSAPTTVMSAAWLLLPKTSVGAAMRVSSAADTAKPVAAVPPTVMALAVRSAAVAT